MASTNGHHPVPATAPERADHAAVSASVAHAAHGAILVFVGGLSFFAFVIGSGLTGTIGQVLISLVFFGTLLSWIWWGKLDRDRREHVVRSVRDYVRRTPSHP